MQIQINKEDYPLEVVEKTVYVLQGKHGLYLKTSATHYIVCVTEENNPLDESIFYKELLHNSLRYEVSKKTDTIKKLILGRALYDSCINLKG